MGKKKANPILKHPKNQKRVFILGILSYEFIYKLPTIMARMKSRSLHHVTALHPGHDARPELDQKYPEDEAAGKSTYIVSPSSLDSTAKSLDLLWKWISPR